MLGNALFFRKNDKIAAALGDPPPNLHWPMAAGGFSHKPQVVTPVTCFKYFKITTYLIDR